MDGVSNSYLAVPQFLHLDILTRIYECIINIIASCFILRPLICPLQGQSVILPLKLLGPDWHDHGWYSAVQYILSAIVIFIIMQDKSALAAPRPQYTSTSPKQTSLHKEASVLQPL